MGLFWFVFAMVLLLAGLYTWRQRRMQALAAAKRGQPDELDTLSSWEPHATRVLRPAEQLALLVLSRAVPDYIVLAQIPLARFIRVPQRHSYTEWLRRVGQLSPDLIVCDTSSQVLAAVEVARAEGQTSERGARRLERMSRVLKAAGIPLHIWAEGELPTAERAREMILPKVAADAAAAAAAKAAAGPAAKPMSLSDFKAQVARPLRSRPPIIVDEVEEAIVLNEPPPSTWFEEDFDPDSELRETEQGESRQGRR